MIVLCSISISTMFLKIFGKLRIVGWRLLSFPDSDSTRNISLLRFLSDYLALAVKVKVSHSGIKCLGFCVLQIITQK